MAADERDPASASRAQTHEPIHWLGLLLVGVIALAGIVSFLWTPYALSDMAGGRLEGPSWSHWAGTDRLGQTCSRS